MIPNIKPNQKIYILDTSVVLTSPQSILGFDDNLVLLTSTLLEELDHIKDSQKIVNAEARVAIRLINDLTSNQSPDDLTAGFDIKTMGENVGTLAFFNDMSIPGVEVADVSGQYNVNDNRFINTAHYLKEQLPGVDVIIVSGDVNLTIKAKVAGIESQRYDNEKSISDVDLLYKGFRHVSFDEEQLDSLTVIAEGGPLQGDLYEFPSAALPDDLIKNEYLIFPDNSIGYVVEKAERLKIRLMSEDQIMGLSAFGVTPRNIEQAILLHQMLREDLDLIITTGPAGTGKSFLAISAALELVSRKDTPYDRIIIIRSNTPMDADHGYIKGTLEEKLVPLFAGVFDSLTRLVKGEDKTKDAVSVEMLMQMYPIEMRSLAYLRGSSVDSAIIFIEEAQNASAAQVRAMLSRASSDCQIFMNGNVRQVDQIRLSEVSNGLVKAVEVFKHYEGCGITQMNDVVRSRLAQFTEENF